MTGMIKRDDAPEPCPFCRGEASKIPDANHSTGWEVGCFSGECDVEPHVWAVHLETAVMQWNTRADRIEEVVKERDLWKSRYEHHKHERLETLNLNAMQASKIGSLMNTIAKLEKKISKLEKAE